MTDQKQEATDVPCYHYKVEYKDIPGYKVTIWNEPQQVHHTQDEVTYTSVAKTKDEATAYIVAFTTIIKDNWRNAGYETDANVKHKIEDITIRESQLILTKCEKDQDECEIFHWSKKEAENKFKYDREDDKDDAD
jgi:hypothetical protein